MCDTIAILRMQYIVVVAIVITYRMLTIRKDKSAHSSNLMRAVTYNNCSCGPWSLSFEEGACMQQQLLASFPDPARLLVTCSSSCNQIRCGPGNDNYIYCS